MATTGEVIPRISGQLLVPPQAQAQDVCGIMNGPMGTAAEQGALAGHTSDPHTPLGAQPSVSKPHSSDSEGSLGADVKGSAQNGLEDDKDKSRPAAEAIAATAAQMPKTGHRGSKALANSSAAASSFRGALQQEMAFSMEVGTADLARSLATALAGGCSPAQQQIAARDKLDASAAQGAAQMSAQTSHTWSLPSGGTAHRCTFPLAPVSVWPLNTLQALARFLLLSGQCLLDIPMHTQQVPA